MSDGFQRRHSAPHDGELADISIPTEVTAQEPRGQSMDASRSPAPPATSSTPSSATIPQRTRSDGTAHHVRFSSEVDSMHPLHHPPNTAPLDAHRFSMPTTAANGVQPARSASDSSYSRRHHPNSRELLIDTATAGPDNATAMRSAPLARSSQSSLRSVNSFSSASPSTRNRGYSLRRSLFNRSFNDGGPGFIELERIESSSASPPPQPYDTASMSSPVKTGKDGSRPASVTVTPTLPPEFEDVDRYYDNKPAQGLKGLSALPNYEQWMRQTASKTVALPRLRAAYHRLRKFILRIQDIPPSADGRHIDIDATRKTPLIDQRTGKPYINNTIRSSRYNAWNFLPRQLFAQFSKLANFYFLLISILQLIPGLSTTGTYTTIVPLLFFVSISIAKEGYDDLRRYRLDKEENNRQASVLHAYRPVADGLADDAADMMTPDSPSLGPVHWADAKWQDVQVGDIIRLRRDEAAPADIVLLHSSGENGIAYIETMALDGETNLKSKQAPSSLAESCATAHALAQCVATVIVEDPNLDLYNFEGRFVHDDNQVAPLANGEVVYRGSILRNTKEAYGLVIYSGEECKIRMNASKNPRIKAPSLQAIVNRVVIVIVCFVLLLALFNTVAYEIWASDTLSEAWYLADLGISGITIFVSFIIMFNTMIPLSLYVSLEIIKLGQMLLLNDVDMYDPVSDTPLEARTSTINEELGQVDYIFSDKTGTLTDNSMRFRKLSVAGTAWLHDPDLQLEASQGASKPPPLLHKQRSTGKRRASHNTSRFSLSSSAAPPRLSGLSTAPSYSASRLSGLSGDIATAADGPEAASHTPHHHHHLTSSKKTVEMMGSLEMLQYMQRKPYTIFARKARFFLLSIALCHTCLPETHDDDNSISYQAASPDELALVQAAQELGYIAIDRRASTLTVKTYPAGPSGDAVLDEYTILDVIEFSSKRKRMSVVVKLPDGRICVICKGADSVIARLLRLSALALQKTADIETKADRRKSMEAQRSMARRSEQLQRRSSAGRHSFTLASPTLSAVRRSFSLTSPSSLVAAGATAAAGGVGGGSKSGNPHQLRDEVDSWLRDRENDVDVDSDTAASSIYYNPRGSEQFGRRSFATPSEVRHSMQEDEDFELVPEAMVVDEAAVIERCFQHVNDFATEGLRTLLYGYRFLDPDEYTAWKKVYRDATTSLVDRQLLIEQAGDMIEKDFELAGATAIEDKLQKGVPETIDKLRRANIKMWMLTGDKRETAINIGHSCRLIKDYSTVTILDHEAGFVEQLIASAIVDIDRGNVAHSVIVVDGQTLAMLEQEPSLHMLFLDLAIVADSVICCRASPSQKAGLVKGIRKKVQRCVTLAIGDGANDIAMIQEAHVGIGITGKEGLQAARTSDYSIAQFRFLQKLLLVHGRWNYIRTCKYVVATFWKEMTFYLIQALYQTWDGYTGTSLYENWSLSMFNTLFTSLPVIFLGIFEKDLAASTLLAVPELYTKGQRNGGFNFHIYLWWMFLASADAVLVYFLVYALFGASSSPYTVNPNNDLYPLGDLCFSIIIIVISTKLLILEMHNRSIANAIAMLLSIGGWALWNVLLSAAYSTKGETPYDVRDGLFARFGTNPVWWMTLLVSVTAVIAFELSLKALKAAYMPSDTDTFQALEKDYATKLRFEEAAAPALQMGWEAARERELSKEEKKKNSRKRKMLTRWSAKKERKKASAELDAEERDLERQEAVAELLRRREAGSFAAKDRGGGGGGGGGAAAAHSVSASASGISIIPVSATDRNTTAHGSGSGLGLGIGGMEVTTSPTQIMGSSSHGSGAPWQHIIADPSHSSLVGEDETRRRPGRMASV